MDTYGWECRITLADKLACIVRLPIGYVPLADYHKKTVLELENCKYLVKYDMGKYTYEFLVERQAEVLYPLLLSIIRESTLVYEYKKQDGVVWVPEKIGAREAGFKKFLEDVKVEARKAGISEETLKVLDDPSQFMFFQKPMFLPEGMAVTKFLQALPTQVGFLQYLLYEGWGPMHTDKETIKEMPLMLMFLVDTARLSSVGMIASAQCTVRGEPDTVCNYYVLGPGGFKLTDKAGLQAAVDAYKEKRI
jgi:hypothetical protein